MRQKWVENLMESAVESRQNQMEMRQKWVENLMESAVESR